MWELFEGVWEIFEGVWEKFENCGEKWKNCGENKIHHLLAADFAPADAGCGAGVWSPGVDGDAGAEAGACGGGALAAPLLV